MPYLSQCYYTEMSIVSLFLNLDPSQTFHVVCNSHQSTRHTGRGFALLFFFSFPVSKNTLQGKQVHLVLWFGWSGSSSPSHRTQKKNKTRKIRPGVLKGKWILNLRMTPWFFHPVWLSTSPHFSVACSVHSQRRLDPPTLDMYYLAVPLVSARWHRIYGRCNVALWTMFVAACFWVFTRPRKGCLSNRRAEELPDVELHGPHWHGGDVIHDLFALQLWCVWWIPSPYYSVFDVKNRREETRVLKSLWKEKNE